MPEVSVGLLGPVEVTVDGSPRPVSGSKPRAILATLALTPRRVVPVTAIVDALWGDEPPDGAEHAVQQHVSTLRKALRRDLDAPAPLVTQAPGYRLDADRVDADEFTALASDGRAALRGGDTVRAVTILERALALWRGDALVDARESDRLHAAAVRLDEHRLDATEDLLDAQIHAGRDAAVVPHLESLVRAHPLRERLRALLMLALYRSGRQADALAAYRSARDDLIEALGIEPGTELRELEQAILEQRPSLDRTPAEDPSDLHATYRGGPEVSTARLVFPDGQSVVVGDGAVIGRDPAAAVRLIDSRASRRHAELTTTGGGFALRDLGSTNGTTVNGVPVERHDLHDGDEIGIGGLVLQFRTT